MALLRQEFPGRQALREQVSSLAVAPIDVEGSLRLEAEGPRAEVRERVPVEAMVEDVDGVTIHVLLHVVDGLMSELEIYKDDLKAPRRELSPDDFRLVVF
ncbi:MAG TPA: hypothetical protein VIT89_12265 [Solirubrobacterales bacterium]